MSNRTLDKLDAKAASHTRPSNGSPMFGARTTYGSSERIAYPCLICSDVATVTYVTPDALDEHAAGHIEALNDWLRSAATRATYKGHGYPTGTFWYVGRGEQPGGLNVPVKVTLDPDASDLSRIALKRHDDGNYVVILRSQKFWLARY